MFEQLATTVADSTQASIAQLVTQQQEVSREAEGMIYAVCKGNIRRTECAGLISNVSCHHTRRNAYMRSHWAAEELPCPGSVRLTRQAAALHPATVPLSHARPTHANVTTSRPATHRPPHPPTPCPRPPISCPRPHPPPDPPPPQLRTLLNGLSASKADGSNLLHHQQHCQQQLLELQRGLAGAQAAASEAAVAAAVAKAALEPVDSLRLQLAETQGAVAALQATAAGDLCVKNG